MVRYESEYAGRYKHWSKDDINLLKRLARKNESVALIARRLNRTVGAVRTRASAEGISLARASSDGEPTAPKAPSGQGANASSTGL
ncbi:MULTISPECIES: hypothetical protein [unclassified Mesorhizobium]|jgi:hypothetical protein|uniref:hypothetical protein n=1 Tax=unclassified Mesorhizobium TaxID=325217 RepID=UPI0008E5294F|nr:MULTISPECIES: hypothetical protein [unclassified Mesorhizobium]RJG46764.1 hypothetical protein D3Y55_22570 [Mesorhizobium sp. DCY119]SFU17606.1 hypothetical protein SAMN05518861_11831 [Mesorhizobium sp. YR577]